MDLNFTTEEIIYASIFVVGIIAIIFNFIQVRNDDSLLGSTRKQYANLSSIFFTLITVSIFGTILYLGNDDILIAGYIFATVAGLANLASLAYSFGVLKE